MKVGIVGASGYSGEVLVKLLNQRGRYAIEIGEVKAILGLPVYVPEREKEVLLHVVDHEGQPVAGEIDFRRPHEDSVSAAFGGTLPADVERSAGG